MPFDNYRANIYLVRGGNIEKALGPGTRLGKIGISQPDINAEDTESE